MSHPSRVRGTLHLAGGLLTLAVLAQLVAGCSDDKKNPAAPGGGTPTSTSFVGIFTNATESGKITITVNTTSLAGRIRVSQAGAATVTATATLSIGGGGSASLTGTYNDVTDSLYLSGSNYTFAGEYDETSTPPVIDGAYSGPNGSGQFDAIVGTASSTPIEIYLGTFQSDSTNVHGAFNVARYDTLAGALAFVEGDTEATPMEGTVTGGGSTLAISLSGGGSGLTVTATGTVDTVVDTVGGTWHTYDSGLAKGDDGTWSGALEP